MMVHRLFHVDIRRILVITGFLVAIIVVSQCFSFPYGKTLYISNPKEGSTALAISNPLSLNDSDSTEVHTDVSSDSVGLDSEDEIEYQSESDHGDAHGELASEVKGDSSKNSTSENFATLGIRLQIEADISRDNGSFQEEETDFENSPSNQDKRIEESNENYTAPTTSTNTGSFSEGTRNTSVVETKGDFKQVQPKDRKTQLLHSGSRSSPMPTVNEPKEWRRRPITLSQMNSLLLRSSSSRSMKPRWSSERDRDLVSAKVEIEKAPIVRSSGELSGFVFRNVSRFKRSYELMERVLRVYIYKEGERPIFHDPYMRGIYASEGWFMKIMEANKKYVVRDPKKAHLFYLPFSSTSLRYTLNKRESMDKKNLEKYLKNYVDLISRKHRFWNRTEGADHFLVACHDWASYLTRKTMKNCVRSLCNANVAKDFKIGKDTSFPVTYIRSAAEPLENVGGKPASERSILAFFAGGMHGYLRPILLQHWENKEPDMKIFGPMPRDIAGKKAYREYMKSSKYCICARGYQVHTPRVVESIFYECVPVIISDNYVPPFFEVLNWEAFAVFVQERDVSDLRNILLSIPQERYEALQLGVKMVQRHFFWHKSPVKYDLFHMTLHSVWHNRLLQVQTK